MRRVLIGVLTATLIALLSLNWQRAEQRAAQLAKTTAPFDWSGVSSRDLNIAAVSSRLATSESAEPWTASNRLRRPTRPFGTTGT